MIILEAHWLETYLQQAYAAGWEAHRVDPENFAAGAVDTVSKLVLRACGLKENEPQST